LMVYCEYKLGLPRNQPRRARVDEETAYSNRFRFKSFDFSPPVLYRIDLARLLAT